MDKNKFAQTPPMGWNSYDYYDTSVNEEQVKANADYMAAHLKQYGWEYVVVDIQWYAYGAGSMRDKHQYIPFSKLEMDEYGRLLPCPERFPSAAGGAGFRPLADYIHSLGLKFGIHIMRGIPRAAAQQHLPVLGSSQTADEIANPSSICGWNPDMYGLRREEEGSQAYYDSLFALYAQWGVDYVKCDDICNTNLYKENPYSAAHEIEMLHKAIEKSGRPVVLSLSPGPALIEKAWHYEKYANMWRITDDFWDKWELLLNMFERCELWQNHVKEGCFPDCDMLPTNQRVLDLLKEGHHGVQVERDKTHAVWAGREEKEGRVYAALFNFCEEETEVSVSLEDLYASVSAANEEGAKLTAEELWTGETAECKDGKVTGSVKAHGAKLYLLKKR